MHSPNRPLVRALWSSLRAGRLWIHATVALSTACSPSPAAEAPTGSPGPTAQEGPELPPFDQDRAWRDLETIVGFGERPSGSKKIAELRAFISAELEAAGLAPVVEAFTEKTPIGDIEFANVYADLVGKSPDGVDPASLPMVILGSHFDTKRMSFEFVGANDGGSSTAVLLELARALTSEQERRPVTYRFLFTDGEESIRPDWAGSDNLYGSRHHVAQLKQAGNLDRVRAFVLIDLVGDADLRFVTETNSTRDLLRIFFEAAHSIGLGQHVGDPPRDLLDDHLSFLAAGVPSVDLIDFSYGPNNDYWHSAEDTLEHCSAASLGVAGRIVLAGLPGVESYAP